MICLSHGVPLSLEVDDVIVLYITDRTLILRAPVLLPDENSRAEVQ